MPLDRRQVLQLGPLALASLAARAEEGPLVGRFRARDLGVRIGRLKPGRWNAITDVPGVEVGHTTIIEGSGPLIVGQGPVRTGVTAIWPNRKIREQYLPCGFDVPNGNGEVTGLVQIESLGILGSPICLTNTSSVGMVYDALLDHLPDDELPPVEPVVGETWDAVLNDIEGRHVHKRHVDRALMSATSGPVAEGSVGGGTGMKCYDFKGGIGTASRRLPPPLDSFTVGVLVQANHGERERLRVDGVPIGEEIQDLRPLEASETGGNSILMIVATDAPLLDYQLNRLARRACHGLAKTGSISRNDSGDFTLAFSTGNPIPRQAFWSDGPYELHSVDQDYFEPLLQAVGEATEEAILNALFMASDMEGRDGNKFFALPLERTLSIVKRHHRLFQVDVSRGRDG